MELLKIEGSSPTWGTSDEITEPDDSKIATDGKVHKVIRSTNDPNMSDMEYTYDPMGRRLTKIEKPQGSTNTATWKYTFYERDAQGNLLSVYNKQTDNSVEQLVLAEQYIYGSSQLGSYRPGLDLLLNNTVPEIKNNTVSTKNYQFSNHLGNVMQNLSDKKLSSPGTNYYEEEYFEGGPLSSNTMAMEGSSSAKLFSNGNVVGPNTFSGGFRWKQIEVGDYIEANIFSKRTGNANAGELVITIVDATGTQVSWHPASFANNTTTWTQTTNTVTIGTFNAVPSGHTPTAPYYAACFAWNPPGVNGNSPVYVDMLSFSITHNGNLKEVASYKADVIQASSYYSFGSTIEARSSHPAAGDESRVGMNGQEKDVELAAGMYTAEYWEYDARIGRRWNTDPVVYPHQSPYACFNNSPIYYSDPSGLEATNPDKNLIDRETGEQVGYQKDANGTDLVTDVYGHVGENGGFVQEDEVTPEQRQAVIDNANKMEERLSYSRNTSRSMDQFSKGLLIASIAVPTGVLAIESGFAWWALRVAGVAVLEELAGVPTPAGTIEKQALKSAVKQTEKELIKDGVENILSNPKGLWGKSANEIADIFNKEGYTATVKQSTKGSKKAVIVVINDHKIIQQIQVHPGGGLHEGAYIKISTTTQGIIKVVDKETYKATEKEGATIIFKN